MKSRRVMLVILFQNPHLKLSTSQLFEFKNFHEPVFYSSEKASAIFSISFALLAILYCMEILYKILSWENSSSLTCHVKVNLRLIEVYTHLIYCTN